MAYNNDDGGRAPRQMVQGNWTCSNCGTEITQLPFEPKEGQAVTCKDCYLKNRPARSPRGFGGGDREMHQGSWKCSSCGDEITQLPFVPSGDRPIYCRNCFKSNKS